LKAERFTNDDLFKKEKIIPKNMQIDRQNIKYYLGCFRCTVIFFLLILLITTVSFGASIAPKEIPHSLTIDQAIEYALQNNADYQIQKEATNIAQAQYLQARSGILPQVKLTTQGEHQGTAPSSSGIGKDGNQDYATIGATQEIYSFGKLGYAILYARYNLQLQNALVEQTRQLVMYQVTTAYQAVILQSELVKVNEETVKLFEDHLKTAQIRYDKGVNTLFDVTRAKVDLANSKPNLIAARNNLIKTRQNLNVLLNLPANTEIELLGKLAYQDYTPDAKKAWEIAAVNRPDLKSDQLAVQLSETKVQLRHSQYWPDISAGSDFSREHTSLEGSSSNDFTSWDVYLKLTMPIFDGYNISGQVKEAKADLKQATLAYDKGKLTAQTEVEQAVLEINKQKELVVASKEAVELAQLSLNMAETSFINAHATSLDVADAELSLTTARTNWVTAVNNYLDALAQLKKAMGINQLP
jgi:outer membrane protein